MSAIENLLGKIWRPGEAQVRRKAYERIQKSGGEDLLIGHARKLREEGDTGASVFKVWDNEFSLISAELRWELTKKSAMSGATWWESKGVKIETAVQRKDSAIMVRFTDRYAVDPEVLFFWNYIDFFTDDPAGLRLLEEHLDLTDLAKLQKPEITLGDKVAVAVELARLSPDYRYGKGNYADSKLIF